jgi:hypothetical protein
MFFVCGLSLKSKEVLVNPDHVLYVRPASLFRHKTALLLNHRGRLIVDSGHANVQAAIRRVPSRYHRPRPLAPRSRRWHHHPSVVEIVAVAEIVHKATPLLRSPKHHRGCALPGRLVEGASARQPPMECWVSAPANLLAPLEVRVTICFRTSLFRRNSLNILLIGVLC